MKIGAATDVGKVRTINEDAYWYNQTCFVVCDGMGGHQAGEVASSLAVEVIKCYPFTSTEESKAVQDAIELAHQRILSEATRHSHLNGMGTTLTMGLLAADKERLTIGHVGDSRLYILRDGNLRQITDDHSIVGELMRNGGLSVSEAEQHPQRHVLTQALGSGEIQADVFSEQLLSGDRLLLCTDGLSGLVSSSDIIQAMEKSDPQAAAEELVSLANTLGGPDNITLIIIHFP